MPAPPPPPNALLGDEAGRPLRVWAISEVAPDRGAAGGHVVMRRHFVDRSVGTVVWSDPADVLRDRRGAGGVAGRLLNRALRTRFGPTATGLRPLWEAVSTRIDPAAEPRDRLGGPADLIFTVAHETAWLTARRVARTTGLPLVTVFHDWSPDVPEMPPALRTVWDRAFRGLARDSAAALCVSEGMRRELGPCPNALILPPIPADPPPKRLARDRAPGEPIRLFYAGLCGGYYAEQLAALVRAVAADGRFALDVCGVGTDALPTPPAGEGGVTIHGDVPPARRQAIAAEADVALVVLPFDPARTRHLRTHFPSKLIEYCGLGRALAVWGPPGASSIEWSAETGAAVPVTDPNPAALLATLAGAAESGAAASSAAAAATLSRTQFRPDAIHDRLLDALHTAAGVPRPVAPPAAERRSVDDAIVPAPSALAA